MRLRAALGAVGITAAIALAPVAPASGQATPAVVQPFGGAPVFTWPDETALAAPLVGLAPTAEGDGMWLASADGGVFTAGRAQYAGNVVGLDLAAPIVDIAAHPNGYWLAGSDGGVFSHGRAGYYGGVTGVDLAGPIVDIEATADGDGYWLLGADGGVFAHGSARFAGSLPGLGIAGTAVGMAASPTGRGYLLATEDGGIFSFGDARFAGSLYGKLEPGDAIVDIDAHGDRYRLLTRYGRLVTFTPIRTSEVSVPLGDERQALALALDPTRDRGWVLNGGGYQTFSMAFTGDLLPHLSVVSTARDFGGGAAYDFNPMFDEVRPILSEADLAICHLETTLSVTDQDLAGYPTFRAPGSLADAIAAAGYDGCSVSSNHVLDFGFPGVVDTLNQLDRVRVGHTGSARTPEEAATTRLYDVKGVRVAHLSYAYGFNGRPLPRDQPWAANLIDEARILADAAAARQRGADLVVLSLHWGAEYRPEPTSTQRSQAETLLRSPDIDLIIGHHAHVVQPIQRLGDEYVVYGLGNFLSGQNSPPRQDGVIVLADVDVVNGQPRVIGIRFQPTWVDRPNVIRVATSNGPLADSWNRTRSVVALLGVDPTVRPLG
jgi:poly-gamma-glutamate synthesis protein (capsule biosynthesis protein)